MRGKLFVCATPIGNLEDASPRLIETLSNSTLILAEDTRRTQKLLAKFNLRVPLQSFFLHNEKKNLENAIYNLENVGNVSLVSDAGVPTVADPGQILIDEARIRGIQVVPIPGPSAVMTALCVSGFFAQTFVFRNFLPRKPGALTKALEQINEEKRTTVIFESPNRLIKLLEQIGKSIPDCQVLVAREMTKVHEEYLRGSPWELIRHFEGKTIKGEITVVIGFTQQKEDEF
ncbi:MAG TPA: 16S rRNA (cytidine(1402)-2'-O)-methyltransferase [Caldisericia bacterium]|nr:16S rRNA (cytidine(1402)-2'-O)-methyltransferase [Caldisericia bacterium]HPF48492.1 16S rRNA (cytidine(1402)-2'-O)-methyltransferase [Caldisericia bacterium]HPI83328.1 16S rRNA (cytidine(1402)-2'-O)-methyltransferase [Caldisericia bacterium]HPQ92946.1 16S rRNA (cytidine(1402)-2'-O)-methyltransferase [Caldisericia bacterium]HRV73956.1 16S rRNA (cytidine(1402)-2'-O)-methyltransferase [Caldisericia bacterium]